MISEGYWIFGLKPETNNGGVRTNRKGLDFPPVTGWNYYDGQWLVDSSLTVKSKVVFFFYQAL